MGLDGHDQRSVVLAEDLNLEPGSLNGTMQLSDHWQRKLAPEVTILLHSLQSSPDAYGAREGTCALAREGTQPAMLSRVQWLC